MNQTFPTSLSKLHFLKIENAPPDRKDTFKYNFKNHFDTTVVQIEGRFSSENNIELEAVEFRGRKRKNDSVKLFRMTIRKEVENNESGGNNSSKKLKCELLSTSGQILGYITAAKDKSLSTSHYSVLDNSKDILLVLSRKTINEDETEVQIQSPSSGSSTEVGSNATIARLNSTQNKTVLSMVPELESVMKIRLISLMMLMEMMENQMENNSRHEGMSREPAFHIPQSSEPLRQLVI